MKTGSYLGLLVFSGLAKLVMGELRMYGVKAEPLDKLALRNHDLLVFNLPDIPQALLLRMRTVEDLFYIPVANLAIRGRKDLKAIGRYWTPEGFHAGLHFKNQLERPSRLRTYAVFVKADTDREVTRKEIASELAKLPASFSRWKAADPAAVEVWGFYAKEELTIGLRLTTHAFRQRTELARTRRAALRPTIAAAMAVASEPRESDVVLDPMCGTGTLLYERARLAGFSYLLGADIDIEAVNYAKANLKRFATSASIEHCDARNLPWPERSADVILCNLPFGKAYTDKKEIPRLYAELAPSFLRVLKQDARMVLLTSESRALRQAFETRLEVLTKVKVLGTWAAMVHLKPSI